MDFPFRRANLSDSMVSCELATSIYIKWCLETYGLLFFKWSWSLLPTKFLAVMDELKFYNVPIELKSVILLTELK